MDAKEAALTSNSIRDQLLSKEREEKETKEQRLKDKAQSELRGALDKIHYCIKEEVGQGRRYYWCMSGDNPYLNELVDAQLRSEGYDVVRYWKKFDDDGNGGEVFMVEW